MFAGRERLVACATAIVVLRGSGAWAGDAALADALFREGKALMQERDYARACPKLAESFRADAATGTLLALAVCQEESGQLASAWASYNGVVSRAKQEGRSDRERAAHERASALASRLSTLRVDVPTELAALPGLVITRDGVALSSAVWGTAVPTDAGTHVVEATATGRVPWRQTVTVGPEADRKTVSVPGLAMNEPPPAQAPVPGGPGVAAARPPVATSAAPSTLGMGGVAPSRAGATYQVVGLTTAAAGVVALGVGTAFGVWAKRLDDDSKQDGHCTATDGCDDFGRPLNQKAVARGDTATVLFIVGGALVAGGATLYLIGRSQARAEPSLAFIPDVAPGFGGAAVVGRF